MPAGKAITRYLLILIKKLVMKTESHVTFITLLSFSAIIITKKI